MFLQTEIIKLGYQVKKNEDKTQEIVDNNRILKYNIYSLESPYSLDKHVLLKNSDLKVMNSLQILSMYSESKQKYVEKKDKNNTLFKNPAFLAVRTFFTGRQAEARTIK